MTNGIESKEETVGAALAASLQNSLLGGYAKEIAGPVIENAAGYLARALSLDYDRLMTEIFGEDA